VSYARVPFHMIANDGNIMEHSVPFDGTMDLDADGDKQNHNAILPTQGIAERFDIVVNFAKNGIKPGDKIFFVNLLVHDDGKGPKEPVSLADVLSEKYLAVIKQGSKGPQWDRGDPAVGKCCNSTSRRIPVRTWPWTRRCTNRPNRARLKA
jgi:hypothetical protein